MSVEGIRLLLKRNSTLIAFITVITVILLSVCDSPKTHHLRNAYPSKVTQKSVTEAHLIQSGQDIQTNELRIIKSPAHNRYFVNGVINNQSTSKPINLMVDTGADHLIIPMSLAKQLNLPLGDHVRSITANGIAKGRRCFVRSLTFEPFVVSNINAICKTGLDERWRDGYLVLMGMDVLKHFNISIIDNEVVMKLK